MDNYKMKEPEDRIGCAENRQAAMDSHSDEDTQASQRGKITKLAVYLAANSFLLFAMWTTFVSLEAKDSLLQYPIFLVLFAFVLPVPYFLIIKLYGDDLKMLTRIGVSCMALGTLLLAIAIAVDNWSNPGSSGPIWINSVSYLALALFCTWKQAFVGLFSCITNNIPE